MYCTECGSKIEAGDSFCGSCGQSIEQGQSAYSSFPAPSPSAPSGTTKFRVLVGIAIVVGGGALIYFASGGGGVPGFTDAPAARADAFLQALKDRRANDAYAMIDPNSRPAKQMLMFGTEKRNVALNQVFQKLESQYCRGSSVASFSTQTIQNDGTTAKVVTTFKCADGRQVSDENEPSTMRKIGDEWYASE